MVDPEAAMHMEVTAPCPHYQDLNGGDNQSHI